jgi:GDP-L-fucose synthase
MLDKSEKIFVSGHRGMVGSALIRRLKSEGFTILL